MKTSSVQSKRRDLHHKWHYVVRQTKNTLLLLYFTTMINNNIFYDIIDINYIKSFICELMEIIDMQIIDTRRWKCGQAADLKLRNS